MENAKYNSNLHSIAARLPLKRAPRACTRCNKRKVRCDGAVTGFPCTNCRLDGHPCSAFRSRASKARKRLPGAKRIEDISRVAQDPFLARVRPKPPHLSSSPSLGSSRATARQWLPYAYYPSLCATGLLYLDPAKVRHLEASGCLHVPNRNVVLSIMHYYFLFVHPCLPLVDEGAFWHSLEAFTGNSKRIPLLLFQAMLFAASCFIPEDVSRRCGYSSLLAARNDFYKKAKMLYEARVEQDALVISQAAVLLSYFTSDQEIWANSGWLHIAVQHARMLQAHQYYTFEADMPQRGSTLKRLWWSCLIRDRIISLGMRRPLQISALEPDLHRHSFTTDELESELFESATYDTEVKGIISQVMRSLCGFVVAVTDLINLVYPEPSKGCVSEGRQSILCQLEKANSTLLSWEMDWLLGMDGQYTSLHPNISLFSNLVAIYYHKSARIALCNKICSVLSSSPSVEVEDLERLENCQWEIRSATELIVNDIRQLKIVGLTEKLPISAAAYTLLPQILLNIVNSSAVVPEEKRRYDRTLSMLSEIHDLMGSKFCTRRVVTLISQALALFERCYASSTGSQNSLFATGHYVFTLDLNMYVILVKFIDVSMSTQKVSLEENLVLCTPVDRNLLEPTVVSNAATSDDDKEIAEYPVWMESIGDFFFGQGTQLQMPSLSAPSSPKAPSGFAVSELYTDDYDLCHLLLPGELS